MSDWNEIRPAFTRIVFRRGIRQTARDIPADRRSVYNWINGKHRPSLAARARIEEIVNDERAH